MYQVVDCNDCLAVDNYTCFQQAQVLGVFYPCHAAYLPIDAAIRLQRT